MRRPTAQATLANGNIHAETAAAIRNAEVIVAMGMLPAVARRWRRTQAQALESMERGRAVAKALTAAAKGPRDVGLQIANVCAGAILVINHEASAGTIVAAAVVSSRLLLPVRAADRRLAAVARRAARRCERMRDVLVRGATAAPRRR